MASKYVGLDDEGEAMVPIVVPMPRALLIKLNRFVVKARKARPGLSRAAVVREAVIAMLAGALLALGAGCNSTAPPPPAPEVVGPAGSRAILIAACRLHQHHRPRVRRRANLLFPIADRGSGAKPMELFT
jgi:hypothetical protein